MGMKQKSIVLFMVFLDWLFSSIAWIVFFYCRKVYVEYLPFEVSNAFYFGLMVIPLLWLLLYYLLGTYHDVKRLYRIKILHLTFQAALIGSLSIFFVLLLDDKISEYRQYYELGLLLFTLQFGFLLLPRLLFVSFLVARIHSGKGAFSTLLIGGSEKAVEIYKEITGLRKGIHRFVGFVNINGVDRQLEAQLPYLGHVSELEVIIREYHVEEVIIALESTEHDKLRSLISRIEGGTVRIKIIPDMYDILTGFVKMNNIFGVILIDVNPIIMPIWQQSIKRFLDVTLSLVAILLLLPVYLFSAIAVKLSSPGPILFLQERIGLNGRRFNIIKFRTMYVNAERNGPQLSSTHDPRITPIGRFMRKSRLDEFPQFVNVLLGDMSLVGPRPERKFYIDQIVPIEPQFLQLTRVRPGITSWGQVKFGYAENIDQMLQRMKYDLLYLKNQTLVLDFKIMLYTVLIILKGQGK
jgi:exopolysaccharide biosynthesis polyprenyl glycosylphosphotransferase